MIVNNEVIVLVVLWLGLSYLGLPKNFVFAQNWYSIKHFDKLIHLLAGIAIASFLFLNAIPSQSNILINFIFALLWEPFQIYAKDIFNLKGIGYPDGHYDVLFHIIGTIGYLMYAGVI